MKIAHIGDIHWGLNYPGPNPESRFNDITRTMDWAADRIIEEACDLVLVAGDCFKDNRVFLDRASVEIKILASWIRKLSDAGIHVVIISGTPSHDPVSAYELVKEFAIPGVEIYTEPETTFFEGISIACLPGVNRSDLVTQEEYRTLPPHVIHQIMTDKITETCQQLLSQCECGCPSILMTHMSYDMADKGFEDVLMQHEAVLTQEAVQGFDLVCLGHIHRPQQNGNVFYCGSPERLSFNDEGIDAGFWIHEIEQASITGTTGFTLYGNKYYIDSQFIETPARRFVTEKLNEIAVQFVVDGSLCWDWTEEDDEKHGPPIKDAIVRVHYTCGEELAKQLNRKSLEKTLYDAGAFYVAEIKADIQRQDRARDEEVTESMGPVEAIGRWGEQQETPPEEIAALQSMTAELLEVAL